MTLMAETFDFVADLVLRRSAIRLERGKEYLVESRLLPLARERGLSGVDALVRQIRTRGDEADLVRIVESLTTHETSWFRDRVPFDALRTVILPRLVEERGPALRARIWSAACSSGQEPYSIAMTAAGALPPTASVEIVATDLSARVLARAEQGLYSQIEVNRGLPAPLIVQHMTRVGTQWQVAAGLRRTITFLQHNLLDAPPAGRFDVVFLRNVLIYFDLSAKRAILGRVARALAPGGVLVLGAAETAIGVDDAWERVAADRGSVYRLRASSAGGYQTPAAQSLRPSVPGRPAPVSSYSSAALSAPSRGANT